MELDPMLRAYAHEIVRHKARQLIKRPGFGPSDREDITQELLMAILKRWPLFDPRRGTAKTFMARIVRSKAASLLRAANAAKRDVRRCSPIDHRPRLHDGSLAEESTLAGRGPMRRSALEELSLRLDLAAVLADLPEDLLELCRLLLAGNPGHVALTNGRPGTALYRAIEQLRARFREAGLDEYL